MADWSLPSLTSTYSDFLTYLKARDEDAASLGYGAITNPFTGQLKYVRASDKIQEWDGAAWQDKVLAIAGGGTGANSAANARTALGLGTIATQNANNVTITGGTISGLGSIGVNGNATIVGQLIIGSGPVTLTDATGKIPAISSTYFASLSGANLTGLTAAQIPNLDAAKITTGVLGTARLGSGTADSTTFLRGDGTWVVPNMVRNVRKVESTFTTGGGGTQTFTISPSLFDENKAVVVSLNLDTVGGRSNMKAEITAPTVLALSSAAVSNNQDFTAYIVEYY